MLDSKLELLVLENNELVMWVGFDDGLVEWAAKGETNNFEKKV